jgi:hypothetical protein
VPGLLFEPEPDKSPKEGVEGPVKRTPPMRDLILFIHAGSQIDAGSAQLARLPFAELGYRFEELSVLEADAEVRLKRLLRDQGDALLFFYSSNFWAINIHNREHLLHSLTGIPLVILMHDHPIYFLHNISPSLDGTLIFAPGEDAVDFIDKHYRISTKTIPNAGYPALGETIAPVFDEFLARKNMFLWAMNLSVLGMNIDDAWAVVKALPRLRRERAIRLINASLTDCLKPLHLISEQLAAAGDPEITIEDLRHVLNFVKVWRRNRVLRQLIDLPILVSSDYVPADLELKYPQKFTLLSMQETIPLYGEYRFIVNVTPLLTHQLHDRITNALTANTVCVTDTNVLLAQHFKNGYDMLFFDYETTNLAETVSGFLDNPEKAFALTVNAFDTYRKSTFILDSYRNLIRAVEQRWSQGAPA